MNTDKKLKEPNEAGAVSQIWKAQAESGKQKCFDPFDRLRAGATDKKLKDKGRNMKQIATSFGRARGVQLCSAVEPAAPGVEPRPGITIAGETFVPDAATAYVEFFLSHAFPVYLDVAEPGSEPYRTHDSSGDGGEQLPFAAREGLELCASHAQLRSGKECARPDLRDGDGGGVVRAGRANNDAGRRVEGARGPDNGAGDTGGGGVA